MPAYRLVFDVLGFVQKDGSRGEVEGKGNVFDDLPAEAVARGLETGALEPAEAASAAGGDAPQGVPGNSKVAQKAVAGFTLEQLDAVEGEERAAVLKAIEKRRAQLAAEAASAAGGDAGDGS